MRKKVCKGLLVVVILCVLLVCINFVPTINRKTKNMQCIKGNWIDVYYETEEAAAEDVFAFADANTETIAQKLGFTQKQDVTVHIYDSQEKMQTKKYGFIGPVLGLDWYIGDNIGTDVILTSPANPGEYHDYETVKNAVTHEIVHAYVSVLNPNIHLWLTEGMALYLANGEPFYKEYLSTMTLPTYEETCTRNPIEFSNCGGYMLAHIYIEYLNQQYGWDKVLELIKTEDYEACFEKTQEEIYAEWVAYLYHYYQ